MHRSDPIPKPSAGDQRIDRAVLGSILLSALAALMNTIVGFTVAHWICDVNRKTTGFVVSFVDFLLCLVAAALAWWAHQQLDAADDTQPELGRRHFMAKMGLVLATLAAVVVVAQTLAMITLHPCD